MIKAEFTITYEDLADIALKKLREEYKGLKLDRDSEINFYKDGLPWLDSENVTDKPAYRVVIKNLKCEGGADAHQ